MTITGVMDVPYLVRSRGGTVNDVYFVGVLAGEVEHPPHLQAIKLREKNDRFAVVDLVGIITKTGKYYARGRILTVVNKSIIDQARAKDSGRLAITLFGGSVRLADRSGLNNFIQVMKWSKDNFNAWQVGKVDAVGLSKKDHPEFFEMVANAFSNNWTFTYPVPISSSYTDACEGYRFEMTDGQPENSTPSGWGNVLATPEPKPNNSNEPSISPTAIIGNSSGNFGISNNSNIATLVQNRAVTHNEVKDTSKFKVINRDKIAPITKNVGLIDGYIQDADKKVNKILEELAKIGKPKESEEVDEDEDSDEVKIVEPEFTIDSAISFTAKQIKSSWNNKTGYITGRMLFKEALERVLPEYDTKGLNGGTVISDTLNVINTALVDNWVEFDSEEFDGNKFVEAVYANRDRIYLKIIELFLGIRNKLGDVYDMADSADINMLAVMQLNPYSLCYIDPRIGVEDLDKLAMMHGIDLNDPEVKKARNVAYMHNFMLDSSNRVVGENTVVKYRDLVRDVRAGFILGTRDHNTLMTEGTIIQNERIDSLAYYIEPNVDRKNFQLPQNGWIKGFNKFILSLNQSSESLIKDYIDSGLGVTMDLAGTQWVSDFIFAKKEMYIYKRLRYLCENTKTKNISDEQIKKCVADFESMKCRELNLPEGAFKLEQRQAEAVSLLRNAVMCLTGPAGSGKTTTAEALIYAAETLLEVDTEDIMFCAPTGKAANRLKEVVKRKTRTINSLFGIGGEGLSLKDPDSIKKKDEIKLLVVDESSMPNVHLMYDMLLRIADDTRIYFLGDREQLPPIGFGKPFATMLTFLPTIVLNVTKRASDKSGITRNAKAIIYESDGVVKDLENTPDFRIIHENNQQTVVENVCNIIKYHLGQSSANGFVPVENLGQNLLPDDIQVISPVNKHNWGTIQLNATLQEIFNKKSPYGTEISYSRGKDDIVKFRKGDRVIHTRQNHSERTRLQKVNDNSFIRINSTGVMNGELGKIEGFYNAKDLDFSEVESKSEMEKLQLEFRGTENVMFIGVAYKDLDEETGEAIEFIILYRTEILNLAGTYIDVISTDLQCLDLAYALTVHKLQGSQAKLIIVVMLPVGRGTFAANFISRNMIYTAITRGQSADYLIGDILGTESCINKGRKVEQTTKRISNIDNI